MRLDKSIALLAALTFSAAACTDTEPTVDTGSQTAYNLDLVVPATAVVAGVDDPATEDVVEGAAEFEATVVDLDSQQPVSVAPISFTVDPETVAAIEYDPFSATGVVAGLAPGQATVTATFEDVNRNMTLTKTFTVQVTP